MSINVMDCPQRSRFFLFRLFGVVSGLFQPILASYGLSQVVPLFTSDYVTESFDLKINYPCKKSVYCRFYYKGGMLDYNVGQL